jgi:ComF family protein
MNLSGAICGQRDPTLWQASGDEGCRKNRGASMIRYLINFIYPPHCAGCELRMSIASPGAVCEECLAQIERVPEPICRQCGIPIDSLEQRSEQCRACAETPPYFGCARAVTRYRPGLSEDGQVVPSIIRRHKYGRNQSLSRALAQCLGEHLPINGEDYDLVVPVPLHRGRLMWRGFNQAALLAAAVAKKIARPLDVVTLTRTRATSPQTAQDSAQRRHNVRGAFAVNRPYRIVNRRVLLIDDVMTTGATVDECARVLRLAGARRVDVLTLARAL